MSKTLTPEELMPHYIEMLEKGAILPLTISGSSMIPFLAPERDSVQLKAPDRALRDVGILLFTADPQEDIYSTAFTRRKVTACGSLAMPRTRLKVRFPQTV